MSKKHLISLACFMLSIALCNAGTWKIHNYYVTSKIQNVYDTGSKVYYLNSNALFQFDKTTHATTPLSSQNLLSDYKIDQLYYDAEYELLFVAYVNSNIDVIDNNGHVTNISNVKDALIRVYNYTLNMGELTGYSQKAINDITFADGKAYVSTGYGYVTIDESTLDVVGDNVFSNNNTHINSVTVLGGNLMVILTNNTCYYGDAGEANPFSTFRTRSGSFTGGKLFPINSHSAFVLGASALYNYDFSGNSVSVTTLVSAKPTSVQKTPTGFIANFAGQSYYYTIDATGKTATKASTVAGFATSSPTGDGTVWISDANGLHVQNSTTYYKLNALNTDQPYWLKYNSATHLLYTGVSARNGNNIVNDMAPNAINTYDGSTWVTQPSYTATPGYEFVFNPLDSTTYFRASWDQGIHKVTNNAMVLNYNRNNSLVGTYKAHPAFDKYGNMWVVSSFGNASCPAAVLPKAKVANNTVSKTDWFQPSGLLALNTKQMQRSRFIISKLNNAKIYSECDFKGNNMVGRIICWDNFNQDPKVDNYQLVSIAHFTDQNDTQVDWTYLSHMEEDAEGLIWVGHTGGLFVFNPNEVFQNHPRAIRPHVAQAKINEDLGMLCEGYTVYDIGIDRNNNKWIGTNNGLYFVSPDGTTIYEHFTTRNSDIPSNTIYSVECDTDNGRVFIYTDNNVLAEYIADSESPALSFDNVYAFPSPVEPDFTGLVKIANLMADTYVSITDKNGNVVAQLGPVTGSALWDACGADGDRLPTGIYNIYVAQGGQPVTTGTPKTTVLIIK